MDRIPAPALSDAQPWPGRNPSEQPSSDGMGFLAGGGEAGALMRANDWSTWTAVRLASVASHGGQHRHQLPTPNVHRLGTGPRLPLQ